MKKLLSVILSVIIITTLFSFTASANAATANIPYRLISETVEFLDDGSSVITSVYEYGLPQSRGSTYSKTGAKTRTAKNVDGEVIWKFKVTGTFSVNTGASATCTAASYSVSDLSNGWELKSATATRSGNKAIANGTFQRKVLFIVTDTQDCSVTLQCDANGNLS